MPDRGQRWLATIDFTDIVGSTEIAAKLGDNCWRELPRRHHGDVNGARGGRR
jgi:hypothetical protein